MFRFTYQQACCELISVKEGCLVKHIWRTFTIFFWSFNAFLEKTE